MTENDRLLDARSLRRLRAVLGALRRQDFTSVPFDRLLELATEVKVDGGLTVDLKAAAELGQPMVVVRLAGQRAVTSRYNDLSARERQVAALIARGLTNKQIARRLLISLATVKDHVHHILHKSRLPNRTAIASTFRQ